MATSSKKPAPASTLKKWRVVTATDTTDIEADNVHIEDGVLILYSNGQAVAAAWNEWRYVTRLVEPPAEPST